MAIAAEEVLKKIRQQQLSPVYFVYGDEPFYLDEIARYLEQEVIPEEQRSFSLTVVYGKDTDLAQILSTACSFPMMSDRQVVLVKEAQDISWSKEANQKLLENYLQNPQPTTILAFIHKHKKFDKRTTVAKMLEKYAVTGESKKIYDNQVSDWVSAYLTKKKFEADPKAIQMISENIGNNLERLANEINKMLINMSAGEKVTTREVEKYIGISKDYNIFELQRALAYKDFLKANKIIHYFEQNPKENPLIPALSILYSWFSKLLLIHHGQLSDQRQIASALKINPFFAKEYALAARNYNLVQVINAFGYLQEADLRIKGVKGNYDEGSVWQELIFKLMH